LGRALEFWQIIRVWQRRNIPTTTCLKATTLWTNGRFTVGG